ncbi:hypothetical protein B0T25DRAFT_568879 [Lasiosphaeria hispida]|uniref:GPI anchored protein n=1 Tax=Lasiosphaeria hispida TaxID=260671 RepID=A0AAJ0HJI5_9PEZI|nr:hypothetical protein B0T25DRAFT_568879 [Lasiosphaeria hispida]
MIFQPALVAVFAASFLSTVIATEEGAACGHPAIEARVAKMNAARGAALTTIPVDSPRVQDIPTALSTVTVTTTEIDTLTVTLASAPLTSPCETTVTEMTVASTVTETTIANGGNATALSAPSGYTYPGAAGTGSTVSSLTITLTSTESGTLTRTNTVVVVSTLSSGNSTSYMPPVTSLPTPIFTYGSSTTTDSFTSAVDATTVATPTPSTLSTLTHSYTSSATPSVIEPSPTSGAAAGEVSLASSVLLAAIAGLMFAMA